MYKLNLEKIIFENGIELEPGQLTVIVGPNNSGKSRILKDINSLLTEQHPNTKIVKDICYSLPSNFEEINEICKRNITMVGNNQVYFDGLDSSMSKRVYNYIGTEGTWMSQFDNLLSNQSEYSKERFRYLFGNLFVNFLNTSDRLNLTMRRAVSTTETNLLKEFYLSGSEYENTLIKLIKESFGLDVKLDFSNPGEMKFRVADKLDNIPSDLRDIHRMYEDNNVPILDEQGDGLKSFVATVISILLGKKDIMLIDEPEAFLHPPQAIKLGEIIAKYSDSGKNMIISTHSSDILRGIISKTQNVKIIRVERNGNVSSINIVDSNDIKDIITNPLLSSARILEGVFYRGVVVVEADADATFYQRIHRQLEFIDDIHYANAQNKQTVTKVMKLYNKIGVKCSGIVDFDMIRVESEFRQCLKNLEFNVDSINDIMRLRNDIASEIREHIKNEKIDDLENEISDVLKYIKEQKSSMAEEDLIISSLSKISKIKEEKSEWRKFKDNGVNELVKSKESFYELDKLCKAKGLFLVPVGELESWLVKYGLQKSRNKGKWIVKALNKISDLENDVDESLEPWNFIREIDCFFR